MERCYCCGLKLDPAIRQRHHRRPRRYFKHGEDHRQDNIETVCPTCHFRLHKEHDDPKWSEEQYHAHMRTINYGHMIYADVSALAAD